MFLKEIQGCFGTDPNSFETLGSKEASPSAWSSRVKERDTKHKCNTTLISSHDYEFWNTRMFNFLDRKLSLKTSKVDLLLSAQATQSRGELNGSVCHRVRRRESLKRRQFPVIISSVVKFREGGGEVILALDLQRIDYTLWCTCTLNNTNDCYSKRGAAV